MNSCRKVYNFTSSILFLVLNATLESLSITDRFTRWRLPMLCTGFTPALGKNKTRGSGRFEIHRSLEGISNEFRNKSVVLLLHPAARHSSSRLPCPFVSFRGDPLSESFRGRLNGLVEWGATSRYAGAMLRGLPVTASDPRPYPPGLHRRCL